MKAIFAILLFICAAEGLSLPRPDGQTKLKRVLQDTKRFVKKGSFGSKPELGNLLKGAKLSGERNGEHDKKEDPKLAPRGGDIDGLVSAIPSIVSHIEALKKYREEQAKKLGKEFVEDLKNEPDDDKVKETFGEHITQLHLDCNRALVEFAKEAKDQGLFNHSTLAEVDFEGIMAKVIEKVEGEGASFVEEFFKGVYEKNLTDNPVIKVVTAIGGLLLDTACDVELDGYLGAIGGLIEQEDQVQEDEDGGSCRLKHFLDFVGDIECTCKGTQQWLSQAKGLMMRAVRLMFDGGCGRDEASFVKYILDIRKKAEELHGMFIILKTIEGHIKEEMIKKVVNLHSQGKPNEAYLALANYVLGAMRTATLAEIMKAQRYPESCENKKPSGGNEDEPSRTFFKAKALINRKRKL